MPYLAKTICNYSRCSRSVDNGRRYCKAHYKQKPKGKQSHPWYHRSDYRKARNKYVKANPRCDKSNGHGCGKLIQTITRRHLDHIRPWQTGSNRHAKWNLFWDKTNWQTLCPSCHQRKTIKENK